MNALLVLIPVTFLLVVIAAAIFFWAVNHAQFDDTQSPGILPVLDGDAHDASPAQSEHASHAGAPPARDATGTHPDKV